MNRDVQLIEALAKINELQKHVIQVHSLIVETLRDQDISRLEGVKNPESMMGAKTAKKDYIDGDCERLLQLLTSIRNITIECYSKNQVAALVLKKPMIETLRKHYQENLNIEGSEVLYYKGIEIREREK